LGHCCATSAARRAVLNRQVEQDGSVVVEQDDAKGAF
jgi:hypothetical protein